jgi:8-oxo-dGTP diphosphatase
VPRRELKRVHVAAAVICDGSEILCVQRAANEFAYISEKWEFPGGKLEKGETTEDALRREIREELGLSILTQPRFMTVEHSYADFHLTMEVLLCSLAPGQSRQDIQLHEHISHMWLDASSKQFLDLDWAAADLPIVQALADLNSKVCLPPTQSALF